MSKTIKQIADELGVSKQAVQKRLSREPLLTEIQPYIKVVGGIKYIGADGEILIKSAFLKKQRQHVDSDKNGKVHSDVYNFGIYKTLYEEEKTKNERLQAQLIIMSNKVLEFQEKMESHLYLETKKPSQKKHWWQRRKT